MNDSALDNPVLNALNGVHRALALTEGRAARYPADFSPFMGIPDDATAEDWRDLAHLAGDDEIVLTNAPHTVPSTWKLMRSLALLQMVAPEEGNSAETTPPTDGVVQRLGADDASDMLELATATKPGPFARRTGELGVYLGRRDNGRLIAMAGERLQPDGWVEISAVCTDPAYRGRGLGRMLMERVGDEIRGRGARPFLHVAEGNTNAIRLYQAMGYTIRRNATVSAYRVEDLPTRG